MKWRSTPAWLAATRNATALDSGPSRAADPTRLIALTARGLIVAIDPALTAAIWPGPKGAP